MALEPDQTAQQTPAWLAEVADLVQRSFAAAGFQVDTAADGTRPADESAAERWLRLWTALALEAWDGQG